MFLITLGIAINLYIFEPLSCVSKIFCWPGVTRVVDKAVEVDPNQTPVELINTLADVVKNIETPDDKEITVDILSNNNNSNNNDNVQCNVEVEVEG